MKAVRESMKETGNELDRKCKVDGKEFKEETESGIRSNQLGKN